MIEASSNSHIANYLKFYLNSDRSPGFAVLLTGKWGIGKTHLVRRVLKDTYEEGVSHDVYVSLYGLKSTDELDAALVTAVFPALATTEGKVATAVGRALLKFAKIEIQLKTGDLANKSDARVYVFDDIERCEMPLNSVLGYINRFVEHYGARVIMIANEKKIKHQREYKRWREKLVGRRFAVRSEFETAFDSFLEEINREDFQEFCRSRRAEIASLFQESGSGNLRVLRQTIFDFERFFMAITPEMRGKEDLMLAVMRLVFAFSFELKLNRIGFRDLVSRTERKYAGLLGDKKKPSPFAIASARYPDIELEDGVLSDEVLVDYFKRGVVAHERILECLKNSAYLPADEPAWRVVWHVLERDAEVGEAAIATVEEQFAKREFTLIGEILHVFGLRLWLAQQHFIAKSIEEVVSESKAYIGDLYNTKRLLPAPIWDRGEDFHFQGYGGLGIHCYETPEYRELFDALKAMRKKAQQDEYPALAKQLLSELALDPKLFVRRICATNSGDSIYPRTPILAALGPEEFVDFVLAQPPESQRWAFLAFKDRYDSYVLQNDLAAEKPWLRKVRDVLRERALHSARLKKYRIDTYVSWYFDPILTEPRDETEGIEDRD